MFRNLLSALLLLFATYGSFAQQNDAYAEWTKKANAFYQAKQYKQAAEAFTRAFSTMEGKAYVPDRYNAACAWSLAGNKDSAFYHLQRLATKGNYTEYSQMVGDADLENLHADSRWKPLCDLVKQNKEKEEASLNKPLVAILDTVFENDQKYRKQIGDIEKKHGRQSKEMTELWKVINYYDSIDLAKVIAIVNKYGWPGPDLVGRHGSQAVFLVIQHADLPVQDLYLPKMRDAVKAGIAEPSSLALLEDRVALGHGNKQTYGSQIGIDKDGRYFVDNLEDPDNVDKRRAEMGLGPMAEYVKTWDLKWDPKTYKKELAEREKKDKKEKKK